MGAAGGRLRGLTRVGDQLFVADTNNHRVLVRDLVTETTTVVSLQGLKAPLLSGASVEPRERP